MATDSNNNIKKLMLLTGEQYNNSENNVNVLIIGSDSTSLEVMSSIYKNKPINTFGDVNKVLLLDDGYERDTQYYKESWKYGLGGRLYSDTLRDIIELHEIDIVIEFNEYRNIRSHVNVSKGYFTGALTKLCKRSHVPYANSGSSYGGIWSKTLPNKVLHIEYNIGCALCNYDSINSAIIHIGSIIGNYLTSLSDFRILCNTLSNVGDKNIGVADFDASSNHPIHETSTDITYPISMLTSQKSGLLVYHEKDLFYEEDSLYEHKIFKQHENIMKLVDSFTNELIGYVTAPYDCYVIEAPQSKLCKYGDRLLVVQNVDSTTKPAF